MKTILLGIVCMIASIAEPQAQTLFNLSSKGGFENGGAINNFNIQQNKLNIEKSFVGTTPGFPVYNNFTQAISGKVYGITAGGGFNNSGTIFLFDTATFSYTKIYDFRSLSKPYGSLTEGPNGVLYGMTAGDALSPEISSTIFSFDPETLVFKEEVILDKTKGNNPYGSLLRGTDDKLYGMTSKGGAYDAGVIFSFDPKNSVYTKLRDFDIVTGANPFGDLANHDGKFYGMTSSGGINNAGVVFSFDPINKSYQVIQHLGGSIGAKPYGSLLFANGKFYGMTTAGGNTNSGVIFSFDPITKTYLKEFDFSDNMGSVPYGGFYQWIDGNLYGVTSSGGGLSGNGVIFSFSTFTSAYTKLFSFNKAGCWGTLFPVNNILFGTLKNSSALGDRGGFFSFDLSLNKYREGSFKYPQEGIYPSGNLLQAKDGLLYGMTEDGGSVNSGVIFNYNPQNGIYTKLKDLDYLNNITSPQGNSFIQAKNGKLYGMTTDGGYRTDGCIFSFDPAETNYVVLKRFYQKPVNPVGYGPGPDGSSPTGSLLEASNGKLYGMTPSGGMNYGGVIFSYDIDSSIFTKLFDLNDSSGDYPKGTLIQGANGKLYGATNSGGRYRSGVIFCFDIIANTYTKLIDFNSTSSVSPCEKLTMGNDLKLYGTTSYGGASNRGVLFSFDPVNNVYKELINFHNEIGSNPVGALLLASDGKLYGSTRAGGANDYGCIYSYDPALCKYTKLFDYKKASDAGESFIEVMNAQGESGTCNTWKGYIYDGTEFNVFNGIVTEGSLASPDFDEYFALCDSNYIAGTCNIKSETFSARYLLTKDFASGTYTFVVGGDDGYRLSLDGGTTWVIDNWSDHGYLVQTYKAVLKGSYNMVLEYYERTGENRLSFSIIASTLPVSLIKFDGKATGKNNELTWSVTNEAEVVFYEVQKSLNGLNFNTIAKIYTSNQQLNSNLEKSFSFTDYDVLSHKSFYRIGIADADGKKNYTKIISILSGENSLVKIYPTIVNNGNIYLKPFSELKNAEVSLYELSGKKIQELKLISPVAAGNSVLLPLNINRLSKGTYLLICRSNGEVVAKQIILNE